jgi:hypothetical protein
MSNFVSVVKRVFIAKVDVGYVFHLQWFSIFFNPLAMLLTSMLVTEKSTNY